MQLVGTPPPDRRILRLLGSGGMGVVYEALDERLKRRVALKVVHPHLTLQSEIRDRLFTEARLAARVEHDNVVRVYNVHEVDTGLCIEMQYVDGVMLSQLIAGQPLSIPRAVDLLQQVLEALAACHANDVVHADLKPGNLLVTQEGKVLLADFGIARAIYGEGETGISTLTFSGPTWGTPQYCPPEAWRGALPDAGWDLYALGVLVYEALSGRLPFAAATPAVLMREKLEGARAPVAEVRPDLSPGLAGLIDSLSAQSPGDRPESAVAALKILRQVPEFVASNAVTKPLRHGEVASGPSMPLPITSVTMARAEGPAGRRRWWWAAVAVLLLLLLASGAFFAGRESGGAVVLSDEPATVVPEGKVGDILHLTVSNDCALFSYDDGEHGRELWLADNSGHVMMVEDINPGKESSNPQRIMERGTGDFLFVATTRREGTELWVYRPSRIEVTLVKDIVPGPMSSNPIPVATRGTIFYFIAYPLPRTDGMWISDAHAESTGLMRELMPETSFLDGRNEPRFVDEGGICTLWNSDGQRYLMRYEWDGDRIFNLGPVNPDVRELTVLGDQFLFSMYDPELGTELWRTDREHGMPELVKDIWTGEQSSDPVEFCVWHGELYFRAKTPEAGTELWKSDGTAEGTVQVHDINPGPYDGSPSNFVATTDRLFFRASSEASGVELCATTGVPGSAVEIFDLRPGRASSIPYSLAVIGDFLCFSADDGLHGEEFWSLDLSEPGSTPIMLEDIRPGLESSEPHSLSRMSPNTGTFVYKTGQGEGLMRVVVNGKVIDLTPYNGFPM